MKSNFYKAMGIPSFIVHLHPMTHFFTAHYNIFQDKWDFFQKWTTHYTNEKIYNFQYYRFIYHPVSDEIKNDFGLKVTAAEVYPLVHYGIDQKLYEKIFTPKSDDALIVLKNAVSSMAATQPDCDNDGIMDSLEYGNAFAFIINLKAINNEKITSIQYSAGALD